MPRLTARALLIALLLLILLPAAALAIPQSPTLVLPSKQLWTLILGAVVPLVTYVLNNKAPWISEPVKATVLVVVSIVVGAVYTALATSTFGLNAQTLQLVATTVAAGLFAHGLLWKPSGISTLLGGGANSNAKLADLPPLPDDPDAGEQVHPPQSAVPADPPATVVSPPSPGPPPVSS